MDSPFKIACQGATIVTLDELLELHHFKTLTDKDYAKCRNSIIANDFSFPFSIWIDSEGKKWTVDGHQRLQTLKRWRAEDPAVYNEYPANFVFADTKEKAAQKILASESKYGSIDRSAFTDFLHDFGMDYGSFDDWVNIPDFKHDVWTGENPDKKKKEIMCPKCGALFTK